MDALTGFRDKDFLEQITLLQEIESSMSPEAIPGLFELHAAPLGDQSVDIAVTNTLQALLSMHEAATVRGLSSPSPAIRRLCLRTVGKREFVSAVPVIMAMAEHEDDPENLLDLLTSLSRLEHPDSLPLFKRHFSHPYPLISALCVQMTGALKDESSFDDLCALVDEAESEALFDVCPLHVLMAVRALSALDSDKAKVYLAGKIHHKNPTARRIIHEGLIAMGAAATPHVAERFKNGDVDEQILSANILGWIGDKAGADVMIRVGDLGGKQHPNVRYAVYEALGRIGALKGLIFLMDSLTEEDPLLLMSVVTALDANVNPGIIKKVKETLAAGDAQSGRLAAAIAASRGLRLFTALCADDALADRLIKAVLDAGDPEAMAEFAGALEESGSETAAARAAVLREKAGAAAAAKRVLAVDDSKAMLSFYRSALPTLGFSAITAENGQEAWALLEDGERVDLIIVDMNMPVMDGVELTRLARSAPNLKGVPIIMATTESHSSQSELAKTAGVTGFINKPFTQDALRDKIAEILHP